MLFVFDSSLFINLNRNNRPRRQRSETERGRVEDTSNVPDSHTERHHPYGLVDVRMELADIKVEIAVMNEELKADIAQLKRDMREMLSCFHRFLHRFQSI